MILKEVTEIKSIFYSKTFLSIIFTAIAAIAPIVTETLTLQRLTIDNAVQIFVILAGTILGILGRIDGNGRIIYTPQGIVGTNKKDLVLKPIEGGNSVISVVK